MASKKIIGKVYYKVIKEIYPYKNNSITKMYYLRYMFEENDFGKYFTRTINNA